MSMSAIARKPRSLETEAPTRAPRRRLEPVTGTPARRKPKLAYAIIALAGAMAIGAAQIGLSLAITQDSFLLASLASQQHDLDLRTDALQDDLTGLSSPQALASSAASLGMVVAGSPAYIRLSDGAVFGQGTGAAGTSTIDPNGAGAVANSLLQAPPAATDEAADETTAGQTQQELPPAITDGLPSPTTR